MKNIYRVIPCAVLMIVQSCVHRSKANPVSGPKTDIDSLADLKFVQSKIDFGEVSDDTILLGKYELINTSENVLKITSISPDCSCTSSSISKTVIDPKDSALITLEVATKNKSGLLKLYATVSANTSARLYILKLKANVK